MWLTVDYILFGDQNVQKKLNFEVRDEETNSLFYTFETPTDKA